MAFVFKGGKIIVVLGNGRAIRSYAFRPYEQCRYLLLSLLQNNECFSDFNINDRYLKFLPPGITESTIVPLSGKSLLE